jgi:predicted ArsR family transcriptional regulator
MEGLTIREMAQTLGIKENAVRNRLYLAKIKSLTPRVLYPVSALDTIKAMSKVGRPAKKEAGEGENTD